MAVHLVEGIELEPVMFHVTRDSLVRYAGASGDFNPIHYRDDVAAAAGLPGVIAQGMLTMGLAIQPIVNALGDPARVVEYSVRFTRPVVVDPENGADVTVSALVKSVEYAGTEGKIATLQITATFEEKTVLGKAVARVRVDE